MCSDNCLGKCAGVVNKMIRGLGECCTRVQEGYEKPNLSGNRHFYSVLLLIINFVSSVSYLGYAVVSITDLTNNKPLMSGIKLGYMLLKPGAYLLFQINFSGCCGYLFRMIYIFAITINFCASDVFLLLARKNEWKNEYDMPQMISWIIHMVKDGSYIVQDLLFGAFACILYFLCIVKKKRILISFSRRNLFVFISSYFVYVSIVTPLFLKNIEVVSDTLVSIMFVLYFIKHYSKNDHNSVCKLFLLLYIFFGFLSPLIQLCDCAYSIKFKFPKDTYTYGDPSTIFGYAFMFSTYICNCVFYMYVSLLLYHNYRRNYPKQTDFFILFDPKMLEINKKIEDEKQIDAHTDVIPQYSIVSMEDEETDDEAFEESNERRKVHSLNYGTMTDNK